MDVLEQLDVVRLQYGKHDLGPGFMKVGVVGAAQDGL